MIRRWLGFTWLLVLTAFEGQALGFPVPFAIGDARALVGALPGDLVVFGFQAPARIARAVPHQVEARTRQGNLVFSGQSKPSLDAPVLEASGGILPKSRRRVLPLEPQDVVVVDDSTLRACDEACEASARALAKDACGDVPVLRLSLGSGEEERRAYVAACPGAAERANAAWREAHTPAVRLSLRGRTLRSDMLAYTYDQDNHMLLDDFSIRKSEGAGKDPTFVPIITGSEMHLYGKPRYFFPLHFSGDDVRSELLAYLQDPLGTSGQLSFFLDVLFFKVKLDLKSAVTIYKDAVHVPVVMTLPVSGESLREGSGLFYGFDVAGKEVLASIRTTMPRLGGNPASTSAGSRGGAAQTPTFYAARDGTCVAVAVREPPEFQALGFHPSIAYPSDLAAIGFPRVTSDFGVFYDIRKLRKGRYRFDVWFYVASGIECEGLVEVAKTGFFPRLHALEK